MPGKGICCVRAMGADSQSERFKRCDLARQAVQCRDTGPPGSRLAGSGWELGRRGCRSPGRAGARGAADRDLSGSFLHNPPVTEILICPKALQLTESCFTDSKWHFIKK